MSRPAWGLWLLGGACVLGGCGATSWYPAAPLDQSVSAQARCRALFPAAPAVLTQRVVAQFPLGNDAELLAVVQLEAPDRFQATLLSAEGFTLLQASWRQGKVQVEHALAPFDKPEAARSMCDDVAFTLLPPSLPFAGVAAQGDDRGMCVWGTEESGVTVRPAVGSAPGVGERREWFEGEAQRQWQCAASDVGHCRKGTLRRFGTWGYELEVELLSRE